MAAVAYGPQNAVESQLKLQSRLHLSTLGADKVGRSASFQYCGCIRRNVVKNNSEKGISNATWLCFCYKSKVLDMLSLLPLTCATSASLTLKIRNIS